MEFLTACATDVGTRKKIDQDSCSIKIANTPLGKAAMFVICDGMGGLSSGECASAEVICAMNHWFMNDLPALLQSGFRPEKLAEEWNDLVQRENQKLRLYGMEQNIRLGTTLSAMLCLQGQYYLLHIGDCRVYELTGTALQVLTQDQTLAQRELDEGQITPEEYSHSRHRSVLLQCIGVNDVVTPSFYTGQLQPEAVYLFCCDGFYHEVTPEEIFTAFHPSAMAETAGMEQKARSMIELNKQRGETDNITVMLVRTY